jgi:hypothetical protein
MLSADRVLFTSAPGWGTTDTDTDFPIRPNTCPAMTTSTFECGRIDNVPCRRDRAPPFTSNSPNPDRVQSAEVRGTKSSFPLLIVKSASYVLHDTPQTECIKVEEFPAQPATLVNWSPLYYPNNDINSQSKYIFGILDLFLTRFLDFSNFQALWKYSKFLVYQLTRNSPRGGSRLTQYLLGLVLVITFSL